MANSFGTDVLIQAQDPKKAALFYVTQLGFEITDEKADLISLHGENLNWFIERGVALGPVLEVTVEHIEKAKARLVRKGCVIIKDESNPLGATSMTPTTSPQTYRSDTPYPPNDPCHIPHPST